MPVLATPTSGRARPADPDLTGPWRLALPSWYIAVSILFVCTGNQCRSPMAAALMAAALARRDCLLSVGSAGLVSEGVAPPRQVLDVMAPLGLDLSGHRSHLLRADDVGGADLVVGMTRQHVVDMAAMEPGLWTRCFTLVGLDKRARAVGPRLASELLSEWVARVQAGRTRTSVLSLPLADDIADPMGGRLRDFQRTRDLLISLTDALAEVVAPDHGPSPA